MSVDYAALAVPGPTETALTAHFWAQARSGRLVLQRCEACRRAVFYPRRICPHCWSDRLAWTPASGRGTLKSFSRVHRPGHPGWAPAAPYLVGLVALEEGPTMLSHILDPERRATVGCALRFAPTRLGRDLMPFFALAAPGGADGA